MNNYFKIISSWKKLNHNWDSYGAAPLEDSIINKSLFFLNFVLKNNININQVCPCGNGKIIFYFDINNKEIEVEINQQF